MFAKYNPQDQVTAQKATETIVNNLTLENLVFIAELSGKNRINEKIKSKKMLLKAHL